ncbi:MAG: hypothetical protein EBZ59_11725 [Planctomycetia bacterium]|nr:hypothetical protein [Planctomycetia bacterium]
MPAAPDQPDRVASGPRPDGGGPPIWLPWLFAPLFTLMPMGGCAVAGRMRQAAANAVASTVQVAPVGAVVTARRD